MSERGQGRCAYCEFVYDLDIEEEELNEDDGSDTVIPVIEGARKVIGSGSF